MEMGEENEKEKENENEGLRMWGEPSGEIGVGAEDVGGAVVGGEEVEVGGFEEAAAVEEDAGALAGGADEAAEALVYFGHARELIDATDGGVAAEGGEFGEAGALDGVYLGEGGADDHGVRDAAAEGVDAFGEAGAEDEKEGVGGGEGSFDPGGLGGEVADAGLLGDADVRGDLGEFAGDGVGVGVAGEEDRHAARGGVES